ncbi:class A beta-lactamase-related serine hydrolase [Alicyclobacillus tolerans]|uniref:class A beta-lactamase-related serine hydrolase n=1 Tax=Alicyclobacillus tolerans TaxID=90970 RepID=UPI001F29E5CA|nr:class A beta-lactamase-related serine hydrolase [Alicyclobacillus tolerans]MCF8566566.1 class A beta-lactamase-related serine hydrolase [Alicyclobacillus tolerans]
MKELAVSSVLAIGSLLGAWSNATIAQASTLHSLTDCHIVLDGKPVSSETGLVVNDTTYMPIWYVADALEQVGIKNSWNGHQLKLFTPSNTAIQLKKISSGTGDMSIYVDGSLVQNVTGITYTPSSSKQPTTYMPIWYVMQVLNQIGIRSNWDGVTWNLWNTPIFGKAFQSFVNSRSSTVSVAVYDAENGQTYLYNPNLRFDTASIVKATIMGDLLHQTQTSGHALNAEEKSLMPPMIEYSNNNAASELWNLAGRSTGIEQFLHLAEMNQTTPGRGGYWGITQTSALDQVKLIRDYAFPNHLLGNPQRDYGLYLMEHVVSWERWGLSGGVPSGTTVALKNGWLPIGSQGWEINSIGYIDGSGRNYAAAVLTRNNPSEAYGIATVQGISSILWKEL